MYLIITIKLTQPSHRTTTHKLDPIVEPHTNINAPTWYPSQPKLVFIPKMIHMDTVPKPTNNYIKSYTITITMNNNT